MSTVHAHARRAQRRQHLLQYLAIAASVAFLVAAITVSVVSGAQSAHVDAGAPDCDYWRTAHASNHWLEAGDLYCSDVRGLHVIPQELTEADRVYYETCDGNWSLQAESVASAAAGDLVCTGADGFTVIAQEVDGELLRYPGVLETPE